jgi:hypothetical protein
MHREAGQERICHRWARRVLNPSVILFVAESRPSGKSREEGDRRQYALHRIAHGKADRHRPCSAENFLDIRNRRCETERRNLDATRTKPDGTPNYDAGFGPSNFYDDMIVGIGKMMSGGDDFFFPGCGGWRDPFRQRRREPVRPDVEAGQAHRSCSSI